MYALVMGTTRGKNFAAILRDGKEIAILNCLWVASGEDFMMLKELVDSANAVPTEEKCSCNQKGSQYATR